MVERTKGKDKIYTFKNDFADFIKARDTGEEIQIDVEMYNYFLEVLPPVYMCRFGATGGHVDFGFAEGAEKITDFWHSDGVLAREDIRDKNYPGRRYYCKQSNMTNPTD